MFDRIDALSSPPENVLVRKRKHKHLGKRERRRTTPEARPKQKQPQRKSVGTRNKKINKVTQV